MDDRLLPRLQLPGKAWLSLIGKKLSAPKTQPEAELSHSRLGVAGRRTEPGELRKQTYACVPTLAGKVSGPITITKASPSRSFTSNSDSRLVSSRLVSFLLSSFFSCAFRLTVFTCMQVSHVSTECDYPLGAEAKDMVEDEWAVSQVRVRVSRDREVKRRALPCRASSINTFISYFSRRLGVVPRRRPPRALLRHDMIHGPRSTEAATSQEHVL